MILRGCLLLLRLVLHLIRMSTGSFRLVWRNTLCLANTVDLVLDLGLDFILLRGVQTWLATCTSWISTHLHRSRIIGGWWFHLNLIVSFFIQSLGIIIIILNLALHLLSLHLMTLNTKWEVWLMTSLFCLVRNGDKATLTLLARLALRIVDRGWAVNINIILLVNCVEFFWGASWWVRCNFLLFLNQCAIISL